MGYWVREGEGGEGEGDCTILIVVKGMPKHTHRSKPERLGISIRRTGGLEDDDDVLDNIARVAGHNRLQGSKEDLQEFVECCETRQVALLVFLRQAVRCPVEEAGEHRTEGGIVELVDHLDGDFVERLLDIVQVCEVEVGLCAEGELLATQVECLE